MIQQSEAPKAAKRSVAEGYLSIDIRIENDQVMVFARKRQVAASGFVAWPGKGRPVFS